LIKESEMQTIHSPCKFPCLGIRSIRLQRNRTKIL